MQERLKALEAKTELLQLELTSSKDELRTARDDVKRFAKQATENWELYQKELIQHGKAVEGCMHAQDEVCVCVHHLVHGVYMAEVHGVQLIGDYVTFEWAPLYITVPLMICHCTSHQCTIDDMPLYITVPLMICHCTSLYH